MRSHHYRNKLIIFTRFSMQKQQLVNNNKKASIQNSKIKDKREGYNTLGAAKIFFLYFIIFTIIYTIILAFIRATFKFIKIIATVPVKGLSRILGPFYNNNESAKKGEESKQPVKLRNSFKPKHAILTLTPTMSGTNNL